MSESIGIVPFWLWVEVGHGGMPRKETWLEQPESEGQEAKEGGAAHSKTPGPAFTIVTIHFTLHAVHSAPLVTLQVGLEAP